MYQRCGRKGCSTGPPPPPPPMFTGTVDRGSAAVGRDSRAKIQVREESLSSYGGYVLYINCRGCLDSDTADDQETSCCLGAVPYDDADDASRGQAVSLNVRQVKNIPMYCRYLHVPNPRCNFTLDVLRKSYVINSPDTAHVTTLETT